MHVSGVELDTADDSTIWNYARTNDYINISKDVDFSEMSLVHGFPPKMVWIQRGGVPGELFVMPLRNGDGTLAL